MMLLWLLACGDKPSAEPRHLVSPTVGVVATTPWIPVQFEIRRSELDQAASMFLDGVDVTDPLGLSRKKSNRWGGFADYLATLDLRDVAPGEHTLEVQVGERSGRSVFRFEPEPCRVDAHVYDPSGEPLAARVLVFYEGHRLNLGNAETAIDPRERDLALDAFYVVPDRGGSVFLPCRTYTFMAAQGVRRDVQLQQATLVEGEPVALEFELPVVVDTPGEHSADLHLHTGRSQDAALPDRLRVESLAAAGLEVVVVTDHDGISDLSSAVDEVMGERGPVLIQGVERDVYLYDARRDDFRGVGHVNGFPLELDASLPGDEHDGLADFLAEFRSVSDGPPEASGPVLQLNHPRGIHFQEVEEVQPSSWGLFTDLVFDRTTPPGVGVNRWMGETNEATATTALDFDVLEVLNRFSLPLYREVRADWFALLSHGEVFTASGNSDSHGLVIEAPGFPVNLVEADLPVDEASREAWLQAVVEGRVRVSNGPVVGLEVSDGIARVRVQAASWVPVHQVRLVVNGEEHLVVLDPVADAEGRFGVTDTVVEFSLALTADAWIVAEAGWPLGWVRERERLGLYADVAVDHVPLGFTNPVFVDVDQDGVWTPPGVGD